MSLALFILHLKFQWVTNRGINDQYMKYPGVNDHIGGSFRMQNHLVYKVIWHWFSFMDSSQNYILCVE